VAWPRLILDGDRPVGFRLTGEVVDGETVGELDLT
jgi:hypothetical protein